MMRARVSGLTAEAALKTLETVGIETPASRATSRRLPLRFRRLGSSSSSVISTGSFTRTGQATLFRPLILVKDTRLECNVYICNLKAEVNSRPDKSQAVGDGSVHMCSTGCRPEMLT